MLLRRLAACLAAAWFGVVAGIGFVAAPVLFRVLARADAGRAAAGLFEVDAYLGIALGAVLVVVARRLARGAPGSTGSRFSVETVFALGALFCIVAGYFALQPMLEAARQGSPPALSFAALHGIASAFFAIKALLVGALAWRLTGRPGTGPAPSIRPTPTSS